ncbi:glutathione S transferase domain-containing protein [Hyaloraphidium curvatum]|nr:glutathione S transferase domain-containing protein [Hyaloraphidium curvatum]
MMEPVKVYHLENSRSQRVLWLLEELDIPYEVLRFSRDPVTNLAPPELKEIHPLGKSPVIKHGDVVVAETGAIIEYIVDELAGGKLKPPAGEDRRRYTYYLHFAEGSAQPLLVMKLLLDRVPGGAGMSDAFVRPNIEAQLHFLEGELASRPWFAGNEFSAADVVMSFPLEAAVVRGGLDERFPKLLDWLERIHSRPAYKRALEKGGPFKILGGK